MQKTLNIKPKIYIAGKVTGRSLIAATHQFGTAEQKLKEAGYTPINPLKVVGTFNITWDLAMRKCITALMSADAVLMLHGYLDSKGACIEMELAKKLNIPIYHSIKDLTNSPTQKSTCRQTGSKTSPLTP